MSVNNLFLVLGCILYSNSVIAIWTCTSNLDCSDIDGSICNEGECVCPAGTQSVLGGTTCADVAPYHSSACYEDFQCSRLFTNFQCRRPGGSSNADAGTCACSQGHHYFQGRCWPSKNWGESCTRNEECMYILRDPYSMSCSDGVCGCSEGYYMRQRGECRKSALAPGQSCVVNDDCQFENGFCQVSPATLTCVDSVASSNLRTNSTIEARALPTNEVVSNSMSRISGALCSSNSDCSAPFQCSGLGVCTCPLGYYPNAGNTDCLAELGSPVTSADQCAGTFTEVREDGACGCQANFYFDEDMRSCVKANIRLNDFCFNDLNCHSFGTHASCGEPQEWGVRSCQCDLEETVWNSNRQMCMLFAGIGEQCEVDSDCLAGELEIQCVHDDDGQGTCSCPAEYVAMDGLCLMMGLELGDSCQVNLECNETLNSVCSGGQCSCGNGYQQTEDFCAPVIGGTCAADADCVIQDTICSEESTTCLCRENYVEAESSCWPVSAGFGADCNMTAQCVASMGEASSCSGGECICAEGFHFRDEMCWPKTGIFETCSRSSQCYLGEYTERLVCRNFLCQCRFDFPYSEQLRTCSSASSIVFNSAAVLAALIYTFLMN